MYQINGVSIVVFVKYPAIQRVALDRYENISRSGSAFCVKWTLILGKIYVFVHTFVRPFYIKETFKRTFILTYTLRARTSMKFFMQINLELQGQGTFLFPMFYSYCCTYVLFKTLSCGVFVSHVHSARSLMLHHQADRYNVK